MRKIIFSLLFIFTLLSPISVFNNVSTVYAQNDPGAKSSDPNAPQNQFNLTVAVENPLCDKDGKNCKNNVKDILSSILKGIVDIALPIVVVMVIYSGFLYVIARGKPEAIEKAHKTLTWTLIGAAILLGAQLIATVLVDTISNIAKDSGATTAKSTTSYNSNNATSGANNVNSGSGSNVAVNNSGSNVNSGNNVNSSNTGTNSGTGTNTASPNTGTASNVNTGSGAVSGNTSQGPVTTTKYYVNATNGANLREEPNLTSPYKTQPYGTVLDVSGENSGFYVVYNSTGTTILGYVSKPLLTQGTKAPAAGTSSSSNTVATVFPDHAKSAITPNPYTSNLGFVKKSEANGSVTGYFTYTALQDFSPYNGFLDAQCALAKGNGTFAENVLKNNVNKKVTKGSYTSPTYTISGSGTQNCILYFYKDGTSGKMYITNMISFAVK